MEGMVTPGFYRDKRVLVTGHTGFKGAWLCRILTGMGARVTGYALEPPTDPSLFGLARLADGMDSVTGDIRDLEHLKRVFDAAKPEIVLHLAAQPIVRAGYEDPVGTYATNVMGTVNVLECARTAAGVRSLVNVTTDKVYQNREWVWGYREDEPLDGFDPYSNSKSCSELVTHCYKNAYFGAEGPAVSTARAGNVVGGGDFARDRIVPDCVRAALSGKRVFIRNPNSVRPYQHVLEPLFAYLMIAEAQWRDRNLSGYYNVGPNEDGCVTTGQLAELFCRNWGEGLAWETRALPGPHEANFLRLDCSKLKAALLWRPRWSIEEALARTVEWTRAWRDGEDVSAAMDLQIAAYYGAGGEIPALSNPYGEEHV